MRMRILIRFSSSPIGGNCRFRLSVIIFFSHNFLCLTSDSFPCDRLFANPNNCVIAPNAVIIIHSQFGVAV